MVVALVVMALLAGSLTTVVALRSVRGSAGPEVAVGAGTAGAGAPTSAAVAAAAPVVPGAEPLAGASSFAGSSSPGSSSAASSRAARAKRTESAAAKATPRARRAPSPAPAAAPARRSAKKGVGAYGFDGVQKAMKDVRVSWYYNWTPSHAHLGAPGVEFVPMIWGAKNVTSADLAQAKSQGKVVLGFNEPDRPDQANLSVEKALDLWPRLMGTGRRLGSPAVSWGADVKGMWLDRFMKGAKARGYRVDFIAVHAYQGRFSDAAVGNLKAYLQRTYARYRLPIWLTEFAMVNFSTSPKVPSQQVQARFATRSTAMLERLPYVERYAWFALPARDGENGTGLYRAGAKPTAVGKAYRAAGAR